MAEITRQMQAQAPRQATPHGGALDVRDVWYQPAGCKSPLLRGVSLHLPANSLGVIYGPSGSGKTTLLQLLAGLRQQTQGVVSITHEPGVAVEMNASGRQQACGLVFQFPERHFLGSSIAAEMALGWPNQASHYAEAVALSSRYFSALSAVGIQHFARDTDPSTLSDGYKRRLALAVQLARQPAILLLDEPLAGLDWKARADLVTLLQSLKSSCSLLIISHDLRELSPIVDAAWKMLPGGTLEGCSTELPMPAVVRT